MRGKGLTRRPLAGKGCHIRRLGNGALGGNLVLARELLECQLHLVKQSHAALRARTVELPRQFCDLQSLMSDQGFIFGDLGLGDRQLGFDPRRPLALGDQRGDHVRERLGRRHKSDCRMLSTALRVSTVGESKGRAIIDCAAVQPASSGLQVCRGFRQSIPSSI